MNLNWKNRKREWEIANKLLLGQPPGTKIQKNTEGLTHSFMLTQAGTILAFANKFEALGSLADRRPKDIRKGWNLS